jgi:hypothetical protein
MNTSKKDIKRKYEPPEIYEIESDITQAMGQSLCDRGQNAIGQCAIGNTAGGACDIGGRAGSQCTHGILANIAGQCRFGLFIGWGR